MDEVPIDQYQQAIRGLHGCESSFLETVRVVEGFGDRVVWEGDVHVFALLNHPTAAKCYSWSSAVEGSDRRRFVAVLGLGAVTSPEAAVRASIVSEARGRKRES